MIVPVVEVFIQNTDLAAQKPTNIDEKQRPGLTKSLLD